jgi:hypothetical protein
VILGLVLIALVLIGIGLQVRVIVRQNVQSQRLRRIESHLRDIERLLRGPQELESPSIVHGRSGPGHHHMGPPEPEGSQYRGSCTCQAAWVGAGEWVMDQMEEHRRQTAGKRRRAV